LNSEIFCAILGVHDLKGEQVMEALPGIWHEIPRNRWRVKLCKDGEVYHRSYHHTFDEALKAWTLAKQLVAQPMNATLAKQAMSPVAKFLRQPPPEDWRNRIRLQIRPCCNR
jgi:hypothetical protein